MYAIIIFTTDINNKLKQPYIIFAISPLKQKVWK